MRWGVLGGVFVTLALAAPASGAAWLPASEIALTTDPEAASPALAVAGDGAAALLWIATQPGGNHAIRLATRPAGGTFSLVGTFQSSSTATFSAPAVAIDDHGDVIAAWIRYESNQLTTQVMTRSAAGTNSVPAMASSAPFSPGEVRVGIDGTGRGTLMQSEVESPLDNGCSNPPAREDFRLRSFPVAAAGTVGSPVEQIFISACVSSFPDLKTVRLALNAGGDLIASANVNGTTRIYSRSLYTGTITNVKSIPSAFGGAVDIADSGRYAIGYGADKAYFAFGTAGSAPAPAIPLGDAGTLLDTAVGLDTTGAAVAAWRTYSGVTRTPFMRAVTADGALAPGPTTGPAHDDDLGPLIFDVGGSDWAYLLWRAPAGPANTDAIFAEVRSPDGVVSAPATISGDLTQASSTPVVGADDHGEALAAFVRPIGGATRVMVSQFDSVAPAVSDISGPSALATGQAGSYAVTATDDWSGAAVHWDFGDGGTADGPSVSHTFSAVGTPTITATATDGAGNVAAKTLAVTVSPAPPDPGGGAGGGTPAPAVTGLTVTPSPFAVGARSTAIAARAPRVPRGTHIRFALAAPATVVLRFQRRFVGRRNAAGRCVKATHKLRKAKRCTRWPAEGTLTRKNLAGGARSIAFSGRIGTGALRRGRHRVRVTATGADGQKGVARPVGFQIVRG